MFKKYIIAAVFIASGHAAAAATLWNESLDGDLSGNSFNLTNADVFVVTGSTTRGFGSSVSATDLDTVFFTLGDGYRITGISFQIAGLVATGTGDFFPFARVDNIDAAPVEIFRQDFEDITPTTTFASLPATGTLFRFGAFGGCGGCTPNIQYIYNGWTLELRVEAIDPSMSPVPLPGSFALLLGSLSLLGLVRKARFGP